MGVYGKNISEYAIDLRMREAARLLTDTNDSILKIGEAVGYAGQSKFAAAFRKYYGTSPRQYRVDSKLNIL